MTLERGFIVTFVSGVVGCLLGSGVGYIIGRFMPSYYRTVFDLKPNTDLIELGMGMGLMQGLGAGLGIGLVICLSLAWYHSRRDAVLRSHETEAEIECSQGD